MRQFASSSFEIGSPPPSETETPLPSSFEPELAFTFMRQCILDIHPLIKALFIRFVVDHLTETTVDVVGNVLKKERTSSDTQLVENFKRFAWRVICGLRLNIPILLVTLLYIKRAEPLLSFQKPGPTTQVPESIIEYPGLPVEQPKSTTRDPQKPKLFFERVFFGALILAYKVCSPAIYSGEPSRV